jgi:hypothetical protein
MYYYVHYPYHVYVDPRCSLGSGAKTSKYLQVISQTNYCGDRGYAHVQKRTNSPKGEVCSKSKRIHS